jgi:hypothetical protein
LAIAVGVTIGATQLTQETLAAARGDGDGVGVAAIGQLGPGQTTGTGEQVPALQAVEVDKVIVIPSVTLEKPCGARGQLAPGQTTGTGEQVPALHEVEVDKVMVIPSVTLGTAIGCGVPVTQCGPGQTTGTGEQTPALQAVVVIGSVIGAGNGTPVTLAAKAEATDEGQLAPGQTTGTGVQVPALHEVEVDKVMVIPSVTLGTAIG